MIRYCIKVFFSSLLKVDKNFGLLLDGWGKCESINSCRPTLQYSTIPKVLPKVHDPSRWHEMRIDINVDIVRNLSRKGVEIRPDNKLGIWVKCIEFS